MERGDLIATVAFVVAELPSSYKTDCIMSIFELSETLIL